VTRPDFEDAKETASAWERTSNLARAYLALLEAVAPLLEMEPWLVQGPWERFRGVPNEREADFFVAARNTADALRDLLTGGEA